MIQSVVDYFSSKEFQQSMQSNTSEQHQSISLQNTQNVQSVQNIQNRDSIINNNNNNINNNSYNILDSLDCRNAVNQSQLNNQSPIQQQQQQMQQMNMSITSQQNNFNNNQIQTNQINNQSYQQQYNNNLNNIQNNQSIVSIKTQANREQQYVYCPTHTDYFITNICACKECIEPLCPECIVGHNELHLNNQTSSQLQNIQSAREQSLISLEQIIKQLKQEKTILIPSITKSMNDNFKKNIESLNSLKQSIQIIIDNYFKEIYEQLNETYIESKELIEQMNAVMYQRIDTNQNHYNELSSPLYIKALIENMETPNSFNIEESSYSYILDKIKENNSLKFNKSINIEQPIKNVISSLYTYEKKQKIFSSPSGQKSITESRRMSDSINNNQQLYSSEIKRITSPLSQRNNIYNQSTQKITQNNNNVNVKDQIQSYRESSQQQNSTTIPRTRSSLILPSPPSRDAQSNQKYMSLQKNNNDLQNDKQLKIRQSYSQSTTNIPQSNNYKKGQIFNENQFNKVNPLRQQQQEQQQHQSNVRQYNKHINFETFNDFNEKSQEQDHDNENHHIKLQNNNIHSNPTQYQSQFFTNKNQNTQQTDKLDIYLNNKDTIQEDIEMDERKYNFIDSFTEEEINVGRNDNNLQNQLQPIILQNDLQQNVDNHSELNEKQFYIFIEGTKIYHRILFQEYINFPKSAYKTEFLDIDHKIPINHCSITVPSHNLILITGGIMQEREKRKQSIRDVYKLDIENNTLIKLSGMLNGRQQHGLIYNENRIYAIGGCSDEDEQQSMNKNEYYDIYEQKWYEIQDNKYKSYGSGLVLYNQRYIYKFGGKENMIKPVNKIECYDIQQNIWMEVLFNLEFNNHNCLSYYPFVRQINNNQILIGGGYQHSCKTSECFIVNVNQNNQNSRIQPHLIFNKTIDFNGQFDFQYCQSYVCNDQLFILKNAMKVGMDDKNIFITFNSSDNQWNYF